jgi:ribosome-associated protein
MDIPIPRDRLTIRFSRSGGPGGQNVNKVSSRAEVRFALAEADWLPPPVRDRLRELFPTRITEGGDLRVVSDRFRDQKMNIDDCLERIAELLQAAARRPKRRVPTRPTRGSRQRRIEGKKARSEVKRRRSGPGED